MSPSCYPPLGCRGGVGGRIPRTEAGSLNVGPMFLQQCFAKRLRIQELGDSAWTGRLDQADTSFGPGHPRAGQSFRALSSSYALLSPRGRPRMHFTGRGDCNKGPGQGRGGLALHTEAKSREQASQRVCTRSGLTMGHGYSYGPSLSSDHARAGMWLGSGIHQVQSLLCQQRGRRTRSVTSPSRILL